MPPALFNPRRYPGLCVLLGEEIVDPEHRSLADEAHDRILLEIIKGKLSSGSELKTTRLAEMLGMSRTPVMQALSRLTADGIVSQSLNQRATVRPGAENWLVDLHQVRQLLEPQAARSCAGKIPDEILSDLQLLVQDAKPGKSEGWQTAARWLDQTLHLVIAEFGGNLAMRAIIRRCWSYKRLSYEAGNDSDRHLHEGWNQHASLVEAISAGDGNKAFDLMEAHLHAAVAGTAGGRIV
ncbi:MAG: GntR family transcriptional regulator [Verrucomicrobiae bacterium]|nr:GntR family transcriptional regulator [Verrucomicrobiae bacterium]